jgi:hypothetical protein
VPRSASLPGGRLGAGGGIEGERALLGLDRRFLGAENPGLVAEAEQVLGLRVLHADDTIIGLSLAAGLMALLGAMERRPGRGVPSAIPTGLAAAALLLAIGVYAGKGAISPELGDEVGVDIGLILGLITAAVQTVVLAMGLASRHDDDHREVRSPK